jgi:uncharacterized membrane protein YvbJ
MFCEQCGTKIGGYQRFCSKCLNNHIKDNKSYIFGKLRIKMEEKFNKLIGKYLEKNK